MVSMPLIFALRLTCRQVKTRMAISGAVFSLCALCSRRVIIHCGSSASLSVSVKAFARLKTCGVVMAETSKRHFTVAVEGNIGSGKTTLLQYFQKFPNNVEVFQEPVNKWRNVKGHNLLELMYKNPSRWSLTFQTYVQLTMIDAHTRERKHPIRMMERSIFSAKFCFVENLYQSGKMPEEEYIVLSEWFEWLIQNLNVSLDLIVYLRTKPEILYDRIKSRSRHEEQCIPLEYLQQLHNLHENWLIGKCHPVPAPVMIIDGNDTLDNMENLYRECQNRIFCLDQRNVSPFYT